MGGYRDFLRYTALSLVSLGAVIAFMKILTTYLGDFAMILYRYEGILLPVSSSTAFSMSPRGTTPLTFSTNLTLTLGYLRRNG